MRAVSIDQTDGTTAYLSGGGGSYDFSSKVGAQKPVQRSTEQVPPPQDKQADDKGSADWQTFVAGNAKNDPPADLAPPPGTTAQDIDNMKPGLLQNTNALRWDGDVTINGQTQHVNEGEGDIFAQQHGYADLKAMLADKSPQAAKDTAQLAWLAQASNNATEEDGGARPDSERTSNELNGVRGSGEVDPNSTGAIFQDYIVHGQSIDGKTTHASARTYADGSSKSNSTMIGEKIADAFKEFFSMFCQPLADLIQMAEDGATKNRDDSVGDKNASKHDDQAIKQDAKNFGKDLGEFIAQAALMVIPGVGEAAAGAMMATRIGTSVAKVAARVEKTVDKVTSKVEAKIDDLVGPAKKEAEAQLDGIKSKLLDLIETFKDKLSNDENVQKVFKNSKGASKQETADIIKHKLSKIFESLENKLKPNNEAQKEAKKDDKDQNNQNNQNDQNQIFTFMPMIDLDDSSSNDAPDSTGMKKYHKSSGGSSAVSAGFDPSVTVSTLPTAAPAA